MWQGRYPLIDAECEKHKESAHAQWVQTPLWQKILVHVFLIVVLGFGFGFPLYLFGAVLYRAVKPLFDAFLRWVGY